MELELIREYFPEGTNGDLYNDGKFVCYTIELPWENNESQVSCVPEGRYELVKHFSREFQWHLMLQDVEDRKYIVLHPANNALKELKGCIAPVSKLNGPGMGSDSKKACKKIYTLACIALEKNEKVFLTIKSKTNEHI